MSRLQVPSGITRAACSSSTRTFQHQKELPPLPVPDLQESCDLYLKSLIPVAKSKEEYNQSSKAVNEFLANDGPVLQKRLLAHAEKMKAKNQSWLEKWWLEAAYLSFRAPLPTNSNYYILFDKQRPNLSQTEFAANIIYGALEFKQIIEREELPPDYLRRTTPQCMDQYNTIYSTSRVAKPDVDVLLKFQGSTHVVIICNGQFFSIRVINDQGEIFQVGEIQKQLDNIVHDSQKQAGKVPPVGAITALDRDESCKYRTLLEKDNAALLTEIDTALFAVTLDQESPESMDQAGEWINGGNVNIAENRWFEKLANFVVFKNGWAGLTGEHSPLDAPIVGVVSNHFLNKLEKGIPQNGGAVNMPSFQALQFKVDPTLAESLETARNQAGSVLYDCELNYAVYNQYGTDWIKKVAKSSPDAFAQMTIQLAYYYSHKESASTYETGTARAFYHGRTDTVRTLSESSKKWTHSMCDGSPEEVKLANFRTAIESHSAYMKRAVDGKVIDRHFLGLRMVKAQDEPTPAIFSDPLWRESTRFRISTSNMTSPLYVAGFGPTEADGYGVCYGTRPNVMLYSVTSFRHCKSTSASRMVQNLYKALDDIRGLFKETAKL